MIAQEDLKRTYHRIEDLKTVRIESWSAWHTLNELEQRDKAQGKELSRLSSLISSLNYEIRGLEITFDEQSKDFINQLIGV